jgi:hypothetical protein
MECSRLQNNSASSKRKFIMIKNIICCIAIIFAVSCKSNKEGTISEEIQGNLLIGWSYADITPDKPVLLLGQFPARISEGVKDPITATVLVLESVDGGSSDKAIIVSCDVAVIGDLFNTANNFRDDVRELVKTAIPDIRAEQIIITATHTHTAPVISNLQSKDIYGIDLEVMAPVEYQKFISEKIASAIGQAWKSRKKGGISYGLGHAVIGHNRIQSDISGKSIMYGNTARPEFSNFEGYEDHTVNLLYTWDASRKLTGVVINVPCPSQVSENEYKISADYWHDTRTELRNRLGNDLFVLPQCGAGGDQSPHIMIGAKAEDRMQKLMYGDSIQTGRGSIGRRKQIATRIADAVESVLPYMEKTIEWSPVFGHRMEVVNLSRRLIGMDDVNSAVRESKEWDIKYREALKKIEDNPDLKNKPRWYSEVTRNYTMTKRGASVKERYELQKKQPEMPVEVHLVRIGDAAMITNSFELYLDYSVRMKARSAAVQTFIVNLTGSYDGYLPTLRSVKGGAYGAVPASTLMGPEGGQQLVEKSIEMINNAWNVNTKKDVR